MEEVDRIIIHSLRSIGCNINTELESLQQFTTELIYSAVLRCVEAIKRSDSGLQHTLPQGMSQRFRLGTSLASLVTELGYNGEIGYQTFLYSNENDIRKVFMFLVEKLPRERAGSTEQSIGSAAAVLQRSVAAGISSRLRTVWLPPCCKDRGLAWRGSPATWTREGGSILRPFVSSHIRAPTGLGEPAKKIPRDLRTYYDNYLQFANEQPALKRDFLASVVATNDLDVLLQQDLENQWNQLGLTTRLSQQEHKKKELARIKKAMAASVAADLKRLGEASAALDLQSLATSISQSSSATSVSSAAAGTTKGSRFTHAERLQFTEDNVPGADSTASSSAGSDVSGTSQPVSLLSSEEEARRTREEEVSRLTSELKDAIIAADSAETDVNRLTATIKQVNEDIASTSKTLSEREQANRVKRATIDLLPDADGNIAKLQSLVDASRQKLANLGEQWKSKEAGLLEEIARLKSRDTGKEAIIADRLEEMKQFRERMKEAAAETRSKDELVKQLAAEYERMPKDNNRSAYTKRILEIIGNIKKQKYDIDKVLGDTKALQKEINQLTGVLERTFTVTDELVFKDAKKDEDVRKVYKYLAALHEGCSLLVATIEETGAITREIRELEEQVEQEGSKKLADNLGKIGDDLQQLRKENALLLAKIKGS